MNKNKHDFSPFYIAMASVAFFVVGMPVLDSIGQWVQNVFGLKSVKLNAEAKEYADDSFIMEFLQNNKSKKIIINATVLYKTPEVLSKCTRILFVTAPFFTRFKRAYKRDKMKPSLILQRFFSQKNLLSEYKKSDIPIEIVKNK